MGYKDEPGSGQGPATLERTAWKRTMEQDDAALLGQIASRRDQAAFGELFKRHEKNLYNLAFHITGQWDTAEEVLQESMLKVWKAAGSFKALQQGTVRGWLAQIVGRQCITALRRRRRERNDLTRTETRQREEGALNGKGSGEALVQSELLAALKEGLAGLTPLERQLVAFSYSAGLSHREIGAALSIPHRTVTHRIQEAIGSLRERLERAGFAAALPLTGAAVLEEALGTYAEVPPGLSEKVLVEIASAGGKAAETVSRRAGAVLRPPAGGTKGMQLAGIGLVVAGVFAAAGGFWWHATGITSASPMPEPPAAPPVEELVTGTPAAPVTEGWEAVPLTPRLVTHFDPKKFTPKKLAEGRARLHYSVQVGWDEFWSLSSSDRGATLAYAGNPSGEWCVVRLGEPLSGACEWTGQIDYTESKPEGKVGLWLMSAEENTGFGQHAVNVKSSEIRIVAFPVANGVRVVSFCHSVNGRTGIGAEQIRSDDGTYRLGFGATGQVVFRNLRWRRLPSDWDPALDPQVKDFRAKRSSSKGILLPKSP